MYVCMWRLHLGISNCGLAQNVNLCSHSEYQFSLLLRNQASLKCALHEHIDREWGTELGGGAGAGWGQA